MTKTELETFFGSDDLSQGNSCFNTETKRHLTFKRTTLNVFTSIINTYFREIPSKSKDPTLHLICEKVIQQKSDQLPFWDLLFSSTSSRIPLHLSLFIVGANWSIYLSFHGASSATPWPPPPQPPVTSREGFIKAPPLLCRLCRLQRACTGCHHRLLLPCCFHWKVCEF